MSAPLKKATRIKILVGAGLLLALSIGDFALAGGWLPGSRVRASTFDGVIFSSSAKGWWTPTNAQVLTLEKKLPSYVKHWLAERKISEPIALPEYRRQYLGFIGAGEEHVIRVAFFHQATDVVRSGDWLKTVLHVNGGGSSYLSAKFNADQQQFIEIWINAPE